LLQISFVTSIKGNRLQQEVLRATYSASIVNRAIYVCNLLFHKMGQSAKQIT
jgi:hypothetical protein